ncbi:glycosyltransferase [Pedobacter psychrodurus]|uniref:glycosyltransferase n=1 Tax=Pedobacter psychrodurus TaxID=2530456 RepID=UPI002931CE4B|nr:glycosyltransferase [Pedobacter psychrodurus]
MQSNEFEFSEVTLLVTHYNRPASLARLLSSFASLGCSFGEIIISDDCSTEENLIQVKKLQTELGFKLITTPTNAGLGNNINKGQRNATLPLTLYVQEDFVPLPLFPQKLSASIEFMHNDSALDIVRFYAYQRFPFLKPFAQGFSEMQFNPADVLSTYNKFYLYSDHPHLRRSDFLKKFGDYKEGVNVEKAEYSMMMSFLKRKGKGFFYEDFKGLFEQKNSSEEPSTFKRNWKRHPSNIVIGMARHLYRHIKFNINYYF